MWVTIESGREMLMSQKGNGGATVFARIAVCEPMPDDDRQWVVDAAKTLPGVLNADHLVDEATGNGLSMEAEARKVLA